MNRTPTRDRPSRHVPGRRARLAPALVLVLLLAGCASGTGAGRAVRSGSGLDELSGRTFAGDALADPGRALVPGTVVRLTFTESGINAQAGCNTLGGDADLHDGVLVVGTLAMTEMGCPEARMDQDAWLARFLGSHPSLALAGGRLTLTSGRTTLVLAEEVTEDRPLEGTRWRLDTVLTGAGADGTAASVPAGADRASLRLEAGRLRVDTGCNTGTARASHDGATLTVGPLALTERGCPGGLAALERTFRTVLSGPAAYVVEGDRLTVRSADGEAGLGFHAG